MQKQYRLKRNEEIGRIVQKRICARGHYYTVYYQKSEKVEIAFVGEVKPIILRAIDDDSLTQLVLPIRTY